MRLNIAAFVAALAASVVASQTLLPGDDDATPALVAPVVVALAPLLVRTRLVTIAAATLLVVFCLLGGFSIGLFYVPAAALLVLAATAHR